jgi:hypothetical protein
MRAYRLWRAIPRTIGVRKIAYPLVWQCLAARAFQLPVLSLRQGNVRSLDLVIPIYPSQVYIWIMHVHRVESAAGDLIDLIELCSDSCHRDYAGSNYAGWDGCHESEFPTYCFQCGVVIPGVVQDDSVQCDCQLQNVIVGRFPSDTGERCPHGQWIQLPMGDR